MPNVPNHFYVILFRNAAQQLFPANTLSTFTIELSQTINLVPNDRWEVGLCEFTCPPKNVGTLKPVAVVGNTNALIYCSLIQQQFVGNKLIKCLRTIILPSLHCEHHWENIYYLPVEKHHITHVRIEIKDLTGKPL